MKYIVHTLVVPMEIGKEIPIFFWDNTPINSDDNTPNSLLVDIEVKDIFSVWELVYKSIYCANLELQEVIEKNIDLMKKSDNALTFVNEEFVLNITIIEVI